MSAGPDPAPRLPCRFEAGGTTLDARLLAPGDAAALLAFAGSLPEHDLLFLRRDITQPRVVAAWLEGNATGSLHTVLATAGDAVVGCATLARDALSWSAHVGDLRVVVAPAWRGKGVGRRLTQECFEIALALGLEKITAQMTVDQRAAIEVFESLGFRAEALLRDHVKDRRGARHDLVVMGHDVARGQAQSRALGLPAAG